MRRGLQILQRVWFSAIFTIETLYEMYKLRPHFRTWWYNTTYTLYTSMVLLYTMPQSRVPHARGAAERRDLPGYRRSGETMYGSHSGSA